MKFYQFVWSASNTLEMREEKKNLPGCVAILLNVVPFGAQHRRIVQWNDRVYLHTGRYEKQSTKGTCENENHHDSE